MSFTELPASGGGGGAPTGAAGGDLTGTYPNPTVAADAIDNTKAANMVQSTIKGRAVGAGTGDPTDLTATQATAILNAMTGDAGAGGLKGMVPSQAAGDAAAGKFLKADGTWAAPAGTVLNSFTTIQPDAGTAPVADSATDTLTLTATDIVITGNSATDTVTFALAAQHKRVVMTVVIQGNGGVITTGIVQGADIKVPFAMTITEWHLLGGQSGSLVIDVWRDTYANYPPTVADTFTASDKPTLSSATKNQNTTAAWGNSNVVNSGDILRFNVDSVTTCTYAVLSIVGTRT